MKKILLLLLTITLIFACSKNEQKKLDPVIKITGVKTIPTRSSEIKDSLAFITRYAWEVSAISKKYNTRVRRGFGLGSSPDNNEDWLFLRDTLNNKLFLIDIDVIFEEQLGDFVVDYTDILLLGRIYQGKLIHAKNAYIVDHNNSFFDTLGYIPNKVVLEAREKITKAFNANDYNECQRLFDEAYVFLPTTGEKWRKMKEAGIE